MRLSRLRQLAQLFSMGKHEVAQPLLFKLTTRAGMRVPARGQRENLSFLYTLLQDGTGLGW